MGVDLTFYPFHRSRWPEKGQVQHWDSDPIRFPRMYAIYDLIQAQSPKPIPKRVFFVHEYDEKPECIQIGPYGDWLSYLPAGRLYEVLDDAVMEAGPEARSALRRDTPFVWKDLRGAIRRLKALKKTTPVILYWY